MGHGGTNRLPNQQIVKPSGEPERLLGMFSLDQMKETSADKSPVDLEVFSAKRDSFPKETTLKDLVEKGVALDFIYGIRFRHLIGDIFFFKNNILVYSKVFPKDHQDINVIKVLGMVWDKDACRLKVRMGGRVIRGDIRDGAEIEAIISAIEGDDKDNLRLLKNWKAYRIDNEQALSAFYSGQLEEIGLLEELR